MLRMQEAIIFDESIKAKYKYVYFPGMCPCIGVIISDKNNLGRMAVIHYLVGTNPESVLAFIQKHFPSQDIEITTFAGNAPRVGFNIPPEFPVISATAPDIESDSLPSLESTELMSDEDYYNSALQNRYEFNYILKALHQNGWAVEHIHDNSVQFGDNVFFDLKTLELSANRDVKVIRDDYTIEQKKDIFFNPDHVRQSDLAGFIHRYWYGWHNIVVTDKRSWSQYGHDLLETMANSSVARPIKLV